MRHRQVSNARNVSGLYKYEFCVKWEGFAAIEDSWVCYQNLKDNDELQVYINRTEELRRVIRSEHKADTLCDSEEEDLLMSHVAELSRFVQGRRASRLSHCDEEQCFKITFVRCFVAKFLEQLTWFQSSRSDKHEIDFNIWCPEIVFKNFYQQCISWAQHEEEKHAQYPPTPQDPPPNFSRELLQEGIDTQRLAVTRFSVSAYAAPFHMIAFVDETEVPFRQSAHPWFVHAWKTTESKEDPTAANKVRVATTVCARMVIGMMHITYTLDKQCLAVYGRYCEGHCSKSYMNGGRMNPSGCTQAELTSVHPKIRAKAESLVDKWFAE